MDILSKLPFLNADSTEEEVAEIDEAQAKKDRIAFHRTHVRNGPTNFKTVTAGQQRRAKVRALKGETRKARRRQIRQYHADMREAATLRGHLQGAGIAPYALASTETTPDRALRSITWLVRHYVSDEHADENGRVELTYDIVIEALTTAYNRWQRLVGLPVTPLSPAYVMPVALEA